MVQYLHAWGADQRLLPAPGRPYPISEARPLTPSYLEIQVDEIEMIDGMYNDTRMSNRNCQTLTSGRVGRVRQGVYDLRSSALLTRFCRSFSA